MERHAVSVDTLPAVIADMHRKQMELWAEKPHRMGVFAIALMLDGYESRLEAIMDRMGGVA